jgi:hypothetical protein
MRSMKRAAIGAGMAAMAGVLLGTGGAAAVPRDTAGATRPGSPAPGKYEVWDYYSTEVECRKDGFDGRNDGRWMDFKCPKGTGKYKNVFVLYVEYSPGSGAPTDPTDVPYYTQPTDIGEGDGNGEDVVDEDGEDVLGEDGEDITDNSDVEEEPPIAEESLTR